MAVALPLRPDASPPSRPSDGLGPLTDPSVSVVVCAYTLERWNDLRRAVGSVHRQTRPALETIVVVDHAPDLLARAMRELRGTTVVANGHPQGLSGARNTGIELASGDVVAFLDDDATAAPDWLAELVKPYAEPGVAGVGGRVDARWLAGRPSWFPPEFDWVVGCSYHGLPESTAPVRNFIGANMSFRREMFDEVGGFHSGLGRVGSVPLGCEETELCIRVTETFDDARLVHEPEASVWHNVPAERSTWRYFRSRCAAEGRSKAAVAEVTGPTAALASERRYAFRTLPKGIFHAVADGAVNPGRLRAVLAIVVGFVMTAVSYFFGASRAVTPDGLASEDVSPAASAAPVEEAAPSRRATTAHLAALVGSAGLWIYALSRIDLAHMNDFGLLSVLPFTFWLALGMLTTSFCAFVVRPRAARWLLLVHVILLLMILHATTTLQYGSLRYAWAYKHIGVVDYVLRNHDSFIGGWLVAYGGWPGFFTANAALTSGSGFASAFSYASWGPLAFNLLDLVPIVVILRTFTTDRRHLWTAVWLYYVANWVGQDYFSPQAGAYFLYLVVIAMCLRWLVDPRTKRQLLATNGDKVAALPRATVPTRRVAHGVVLVVVLAIVSSHQLTPYMLIAALAALVLARTRRTGLLAIGVTIMAGGWAALFARSFFKANSWILTSFGRPASNAATGLDALSPHRSAPQILVSRVDRVAVATIWILAIVGFVRRRKSWRRDLPLALLALTPLPMFLGNDYGGEMLLRVFLFSLVPLSFFAAAAIFPSRDRGRSPLTTPVLTLVAGLLLVGFMFPYFGKERANHFTPKEIAAAEWLFNRPGRALIAGMSDNMPSAFHNYEKYDYEWLIYETPKEQRQLVANPSQYLTARFAEAGYHDTYVVLTKSQKAALEMGGAMPPNAFGRVERSLLASPSFSVAYRNSDATILRYTGAR